MARFVWFHPKGIANNLSLARLKEKFRVTLDSKNGNKFVVHKKNASKRYSNSQKEDCITLELVMIISKKIDENQNTILNTVEQIKYGYSKRGYSRAVLACNIR